MKTNVTWLAVGCLVAALGGCKKETNGTDEDMAMGDPLDMSAEEFNLDAFLFDNDGMYPDGYVLPRLQVLSGNTGLAVAAVVLLWSFQHAAMPLTFDADFMTYRALSPIFHSTFVALVYLRIRRILPLATAHWLMGNFPASLADICETVKREPRHFGAYSGLGMIRAEMGENARAVAAFELARKWNPHIAGIDGEIERLKALGGDNTADSDPLGCGRPTT